MKKIFLYLFLSIAAISNCSSQLNFVKGVHPNTLPTTALGMIEPFWTKKQLELNQYELNQKLLRAAQYGKLTEVKDLLRQGANPNTQDLLGVTALMDVTKTIITDHSVLMVEVLLEAGAHLNQPSTSDHGLMLSEDPNLTKLILKYIKCIANRRVIALQEETIV